MGIAFPLLHNGYLGERCQLMIIYNLHDIIDISSSECDIPTISGW